MADRSAITASDVRARVDEATRAELDRALAAAADLGSAETVERGLEAASLLLDLTLPPPTAVAAVLVAATDPGEVVPELETRFSEDVAGLARGVARLAAVRWDELEREATESLRKMFLAMASDVRVVLIALANRTVALRRIDDLPAAERMRLARTAKEVFAPLANRLGIWQLKWELEDLAFRELQSDTYRRLGKLLAEKRSARRAALDQVITTLQRDLAQAEIEGTISGRPKHIYSIYSKMLRKNVGFEEIYDVSAVRVIVEELGQCYAVLGLVHGKWQPISGEFDDYIAKPKPNGYRSLHTAVHGPGGRPLEVQIRTREMHEFGEFGVAAHWRYKEATKSDRAFDEKINWLRQLMQWQRDVTDPDEVARSLKSDLFGDQVFVFTPSGEVIDLPQGATPIDFAYRIHTMVGHRCRGAKIDGHIVPLHHALQTGDRVEIITAKNGTPSRDWLNPNLGYVKTGSARAKVRQHFRAQERDTSIAQGREIVERELKRLGIDDRKIDDVALLCDYDDAEDFLARLGFGDFSAQHVASRLLEAERARAPKPEAPPPVAAPARKRGKAAASVSLDGVTDVMSTPARCCHPVPGDEVLGYITRGRGLIIHRADCPNVINHPEPERLMGVDWGMERGASYPVDVRVVARDRAGLLRDVAEVVAQEGVNVLRVEAQGRTRDEDAVLEATLEIRNTEQLLRVLARLERLPYVESVRRVAG